MSSWDEYIFNAPGCSDYLDDIAELELADRMDQLRDSITIAQRQAYRGDEDHTIGLCAASIVAIWCGAPYSTVIVSDHYPFIREGINDPAVDIEADLQERAAELLDAELEQEDAGSEEVLEGLETYSEALS